MRKKHTAGILLIGTILLISIGNFTIAQGSSYVGISEGEEYIWDLGLNKVGVNNLKDDTEILVQEIFSNISALDLGAYTDLNASEALLLGIEDSIDFINEIFPPGLIPDDWKTLNLSTLMEDLIDQVVETFNGSFLQGEIPYDWKSENIVSFFDHVIDGLNKTTPGLDNFTLGEVIETLINVIDDSCPIELLPEGWEDMPIFNLIEIYLGYPVNFINTTILPGMIPSDWLHMDLSLLLQNVFPILPQTLIDLLASSIPSVPGGNSIFTFFDQYAQLFNISLFPGLIPGDWDDYSIPELIFPLLLGPYADYNLTSTFYELFEAINSSAPFDLYAVNMSSLINMTIYSVTAIFPTEIQSMPTLDILRNVTSSYLLLMNDAYTSSGIFPDNWMSLTIDNLRTYYLDQAQTLFDQYMVEFETYLTQFELLGGFQKISLKAIIDHIGDEIDLIPGGPKGVPIDISIQIKVPLSDWVNLTDLLEIDIFEYYPIYILNPTTFSVDKGALIEQFLSTGGLFIGTSYDWTDIVTEYEFPGPVTGKVLNFEIDWNNKGVLDHVVLEYDGQEVAFIDLQTPPTEPGIISGYNLLIFTGITLFSMSATIRSIKKKKTKF